MSRRPPEPPPRGLWDIANQLGKVTLKEASSMDILFLIDATSSMRIHRNVIVEQLEETIRNMVAMFPSSSINVGVVAYRDTLLAPLVEELKFRELADADGGGMRDVIQWLQNLQFHSGIFQDVPEDVHVGLERAASEELGWSSRSRAIIHIADAPGHGRRLACRSAPSKYTDDDQPDFDMDGAQLKELLRKLREDRKVNEYAFIHALTTDAQTGMRYKLAEVMVEKMREACEDPAWIQEFDWYEDDFRNQICNVASTSRQRSLNPTKRPEDALPEHVMVEEEHDWDDVEESGRGDLDGPVGDPLAAPPPPPLVVQPPPPPRLVKVPSPPPLVVLPEAPSWDPEMFMNATPEQKKRMLGERIFVRVAVLQPALCAKITGMLLEMDNTELMCMLMDDAAVKEKVYEALKVLEEHGTLPKKTLSKDFARLHGL